MKHLNSQSVTQKADTNPKTTIWMLLYSLFRSFSTNFPICLLSIGQCHWQRLIEKWPFLIIDHPITRHRKNLWPLFGKPPFSFQTKYRQHSSFFRLYFNAWMYLIRFISSLYSSIYLTMLSVFIASHANTKTRHCILNESSSASGCFWAYGCTF